MKKIVNKQKVDEITLEELLGGNFADKIIFYQDSDSKCPMFLKNLNPYYSVNQHKYGFMSPILGNKPAFVEPTLMASIKQAMASRQVYMLSREEWSTLFCDINLK